ncbi:MAG TPA: dienelactone hydrolase family protein [Gemmatimonadales bacterium]|nr:dienelactone hydrolase family protein [Gemmatimonadales bacterium]
MSAPHSSRRGAVATYVLVGLVALLIGAAAMQSFTGPGESLEVPMDRVTTHGEWIYIKRGQDSIRAYVAYPERKTKAPAVIVIHEIFGLTDWEPKVADRLAKEGFVAILPDLLSSKYGITPADPDSGRKLIGQLEPKRITDDLHAVYAYVNGLPSVAQDQIGTIGFCWGGGQSFRYATNNPKLRAAVVAYGPAPDTADLKKIQAPVLGIYGENDERINASLPMVTAEMQSAGKTFTSEVYPGTGHGFLKPGRQGSNGPQVEKAWARILEFYRARLGK